MPVDIENYVEPEVGIAVAATAVVASPSLRRIVRKSAVYGLAGVLVAYDRVVSGVERVAKTVRREAAPVAAATAETAPTS